MGDNNQFAMIFEMLAEAMEQNADMLAEAQYTYFEALQEAGFTEEQAMEIVVTMGASNE